MTYSIPMFNITHNLEDQRPWRLINFKSENHKAGVFYNIWLIREPGQGFYIVKKESGTIHKRLDARSWKFDNFILAKHFYQKKSLKKQTRSGKFVFIAT